MKLYWNYRGNGRTVGTNIDMALQLRPKAIPQCSACIRSYVFGNTTEQPAMGALGLGQQVRGKKKMVNTSGTVSVRLLKNVKTFGRKGKICISRTNPAAYVLIWALQAP